jgi:hypothetical protein
VKLEVKLWREVQTGLVSRREGVAGSSPVVDTNDQCVGLGKFVVGRHLNKIFVVLS